MSCYHIRFRSEKGRIAIVDRDNREVGEIRKIWIQPEHGLRVVSEVRATFEGKEHTETVRTWHSTEGLKQIRSSDQAIRRCRRWVNLLAGGYLAPAL